MSDFWTLAEVTVRALLGRRRAILMVLLAALPVIVALLARIGDARLEGALTTILELGVRTVLPLTALVFGTSSIGAEMDDGTAVYILAKPIPRWKVAAAKVFVAGLLSAALSVGSTILTGFLVSGADATSIGTTFAFAVASAIAAFAYAALFVALSVVTSRALIIGLIYTLVWEGILAGILEGTRVFSIREATLTLAEALGPATAEIDGDVDLVTAVGLVVVVLALALAITTTRLSTFEVRGTE